jgi:putative transposase
MSDLALPSSPPSPPASSQRWLDLETAASLSGQSVRHLRRLCGDRWQREGLAQLIQEPGKKSCWQVRSDAGPAFSLSPSSPSISPAVADRLVNLSKKARDRAQEKARILVEWKKALAAGVALGLTNGQATAMFLGAMPEKDRISPATLYNWEAAGKEGLTGLIDGRNASSSVSEGGEFLDAVLHHWKSQTGRKVKVCYDMAMGQALTASPPWQIPSYRTARRFIESWAKSNPGAAIFAREGESAFTDKIEPSITGDYSTLETNEMWNADHHLLDVLVKVGERTNKATGEVVPIHARPWLTAWQDLRSRKIVGYVIRDADPNTDVIIEALDIAIETHGAPKTCLTDNGKDFDCRYLTGQTKAARWKSRKLRVVHDDKRLGGLYAVLKIKHIHAWPWHGQSKPIERFFGTVEGRFCRTFDTYCGRSPEEKPEHLSDYHGKPGMLSRGKAPTLEEFSSQFAGWLEADYHGQIHAGDSMNCTPNQAFEANLHSKRTIPAELRKVLLQPAIGPLKVTQDGVRHNHISYGNREILHLFGREVFIRIDRNDVGVVTLFDGQDKPLAVAHANRLLPKNASQEDLREAINLKRSYAKTLKGASEARLHIHEDETDILIRSQADKARQLAAVAPPTDPTPPNMSPVRSDLEALLPALQRMQQSPQQLKKAVGAESFDFLADLSDDAQQSAPRLSITDILGEE